MKKDNILTIISVFLLASPLAVFFLNNGTYEQLLYLDAASGHNIKYTLLGVSTITIMYLVIRHLYASDRQRPYVFYSVTSLLITLISETVFLLGLTGITSHFSILPFGTEVGFLISFVLILQLLVSVGIDSDIYGQKQTGSVASNLLKAHTVHISMVLVIYTASIVFFVFLSVLMPVLQLILRIGASMILWNIITYLMFQRYISPQFD